MSWTIEACVLCGSETEPRVLALIEWLEPIGREQWSHIPRCEDRAACRDRVENVLGEAWPVNDRTPAPERPARPDPQPVAETPSPDVAEEIPWLHG